MKIAQQLAFLLITTIGYAQREMTIGEQFKAPVPNFPAPALPTPPPLAESRRTFSVWGDKMPDDVEPSKIKIKRIYRKKKTKRN